MEQGPHVVIQILPQQLELDKSKGEQGLRLERKSQEITKEWIC